MGYSNGRIGLKGRIGGCVLFCNCVVGVVQGEESVGDRVKG